MVTLTKFHDVWKFFFCFSIEANSLVSHFRVVTVPVKQPLSFFFFADGKQEFQSHCKFSRFLVFLILPSWRRQFVPITLWTHLYHLQKCYLIWKSATHLLLTQNGNQVIKEFSTKNYLKGFQIILQHTDVS